MHENLIEDLFFGDLIPVNSMTHKTEDYLEASKKTDELNELLVNSLDEKQKELLDELLEAKDTMTDEMVLGAFKDGFKLGMGLTAQGLMSGNWGEA